MVVSTMSLCYFKPKLLLSLLQANNNEPLQIVCGYHALPLPPRGGEIIFNPLEHLQPIKYCRPSVSSLGFDGISNAVPSSPKQVIEVKSAICTATLFSCLFPFFSSSFV